MGLFDSNQNPFALSQQSLQPIHTGTIFDPLIGLASQIRSQQNDQVKAELAKKAQSDAIARANALNAQKFQQQKDIVNLGITNKQKIADAKAAKKEKERIARVRSLSKGLGVNLTPQQEATLTPDDIKAFRKVKIDNKKGKPAKPLSVTSADIKAIPITLSADKDYVTAIAQSGDASGTIDSQIASKAAKIQRDAALNNIPMSRTDATVQAWSEIKQTPGFFVPADNGKPFNIAHPIDTFGGLLDNKPATTDPSALLGNNKNPDSAIKYKTADDVKAAFSIGAITKEQALSILKKDFGFR